MDRRKFLESMAAIGALGVSLKASGAERWVDALCRKAPKKVKKTVP